MTAVAAVALKKTAFPPDWNSVSSSSYEKELDASYVRTYNSDLTADLWRFDFKTNLGGYGFMADTSADPDGVPFGGPLPATETTRWASHALCTVVRSALTCPCGAGVGSRRRHRRRRQHFTSEFPGVPSFQARASPRHRVRSGSRPTFGRRGDACHGALL